MGLLASERIKFWIIQLLKEQTFECCISAPALTNQEFKKYLCSSLKAAVLCGFVVESRMFGYECI